MSKSVYALSITAFTVAGIVFAAWMSTLSMNWDLSNGWALAGFFVGVVVAAVVGIVIFNKSDVPLISLIGYALVAGPFGLLLGPLLVNYSETTVTRVFLLTALVTIILGFVGAIIPRSLESWTGWLLGAMVVLIVGLFAIPLLGSLGLNVGGAMKLWDWFGVLIFSGMIVLDLNRAMRLPRTLDNSIDSATAIFLDVLNLFLWLLQLVTGNVGSNNS